VARGAGWAQAPAVVLSSAPPLDAPPALPPPPPAAYAYGQANAPGDIYPRGPRETELCERSSRPDWLYLGGLVLLNAGAIAYGSADSIVDGSSVVVRFTAPTFVGLAWGVGIGGGWLALPHCDPHFVGELPREGDVRANWPVALSLALLGGATAPMINGILVGGNQPIDWSTPERTAHVLTAAFAGFAGALLPYLLPPRTWTAARELEHLRVGTDARGGFSVGWQAAF
jgi:hypothetical protein